MADIGGVPHVAWSEFSRGREFKPAAVQTAKLSGGQWSLVGGTCRCAPHRLASLFSRTCWCRLRQSWVAWPSPPPAWVAGGKPLQTSRGGVIVHDYGDEPRPYTAEMRMPIGCNFACRRSLFKAVGLFNIYLGPQPGAQIAGEETDMLRRFQAHGETVFYAPFIRVFHPVDPARLTKPTSDTAISVTAAP